MNKYRKRRSKFIRAFPRGDFGALPRELRGLGQNRFGGHHSTHFLPFKGSKLGPASRGRRVIDPDERLTIIRDLRERGVIT